MTDAGGFPPPNGLSGAAERERLLRQIATALDLPVAAFAGSGSGSSQQDAPSSAECSAVLAAFSRISDPQARTFCLTMLETFASK